jgi:hypothetical protein
MVATTATYSDQERDMSPSRSQPTLNEFVDEQGLLELLDTYYRHRRPTLLIGEPGVGKTTLVELLAEQKRSRLIQKTGGDYSVSKLVGQHELRAEGGATTTAFVKGPLLRALETGAIFYFDEIDASSADCQDLLHQILDHRRAISKADIGLKVTTGEDEFIYPHPDFWFVATCVQISRLPTDFLDRFRVIVVKRLSLEKQIEFLNSRFPAICAQTTERIVQIGDLTVRLGWFKPASFRQVCSTLQDIQDGIDSEIAIANNLVNPNAVGEHDKVALREAMNSAGLSAEKLFADVVTPGDKFQVPHFDLDLDVDSDFQLAPEVSHGGKPIIGENTDYAKFQREHNEADVEPRDIHELMGKAIESRRTAFRAMVAEELDNEELAEQESRLD